MKPIIVGKINNHNARSGVRITNTLNCVGKDKWKINDIRLIYIS